MVLEHKGRLQMVGGMDREMATCSRALGGTVCRDRARQGSWEQKGCPEEWGWPDQGCGCGGGVKSETVSMSMVPQECPAAGKGLWGSPRNDGRKSKTRSVQPRGIVGVAKEQVRSVNECLCCVYL